MYFSGGKSPPQRICIMMINPCLFGGTTYKNVNAMLPTYYTFFDKNKGTGFFFFPVKGQQLKHSDYVLPLVYLSIIAALGSTLLCSLPFWTQGSSGFDTLLSCQLLLSCLLGPSVFWGCSSSGLAAPLGITSGPTSCCLGFPLLWSRNLFVLAIFLACFYVYFHNYTLLI